MIRHISNSNYNAYKNVMALSDTIKRTPVLA